LDLIELQKFEDLNHFNEFSFIDDGLYQDLDTGRIRKIFTFEPE
jgi:hypothetical protein